MDGHPAEQVIDKMVDELGRAGRLRGAGFYDYDESGKRTGLWKGLREEFPVTGDPSQLSLATSRSGCSSPRRLRASSAWTRA